MYSMVNAPAPFCGGIAMWCDSDKPALEGPRLVRRLEDRSAEASLAYQYAERVNMLYTHLCAVQVVWPNLSMTVSIRSGRMYLL
jgi:hypothetical protein